ncbi:MAG TPA: DUF4331 family protein [Pseudonocardia sp.]|jgi:hypothetical protein|nr:DUF4331 family protein [Pseudonocardia sp.]
MSNHLSGKNLTFPAGDARLDLTDVFAFLSPTDPGRTVLIMDANTFATGTEFHPDAVYQLNIDTDGDNETDVCFSTVFSAPDDGQQTATVHHSTGTDARGLEATGTVLVDSAPVAFGAEPRITEAGPVQFFAGVRSDPFFADLEGLMHDFQWTGADAFGDKNVFSIALEVPNELLGDNPAFGVWARINVRRDGTLVQIDRGAHPSLTAFFNPEDVKEAYNADQPAKDHEHYHEAWSQVLEKAGYTGQEAGRALNVILPDVLRFDRSQPAGYPNGRALTDDVFDARLAVVTHGQVSGDKTGAHTDLLAEFPFLGHPHPAPQTAGD